MTRPTFPGGATVQTTRTDRRPPTTKAITPKIHDTELVDDMDVLLDEIDSVLEENVLETLRLFVQKGGQ
jgi:ubiquitin-like protein Pup